MFCKHRNSTHDKTKVVLNQILNTFVIEISKASVTILSQHRIIMKAFIESQFGYCPFGNSNLNNVMNNIQDRVLHLVYTDCHS